MQTHILRLPKIPHSNFFHCALRWDFFLKTIFFSNPTWGLNSRPQDQESHALLRQPGTPKWDCFESTRFPYKSMKIFYLLFMMDTSHKHQDILFEVTAKEIAHSPPPQGTTLLSYT